MNREEKAQVGIGIAGITLAIMAIGVCTFLWWLGFTDFGSFQGQPYLEQENGAVIQRLDDGSWKFFPSPSLRWTDSSLEKIGGSPWYEK